MSDAEMELKKEQGQDETAVSMQSDGNQNDEHESHSKRKHSKHKSHKKHRSSRRKKKKSKRRRSHTRSESSEKEKRSESHSSRSSSSSSESSVPAKKEKRKKRRKKRRKRSRSSSYSSSSRSHSRHKSRRSKRKHRRRSRSSSGSRSYSSRSHSRNDTGRYNYPATAVNNYEAYGHGHGHAPYRGGMYPNSYGTYGGGGRGRGRGRGYFRRYGFQARGRATDRYARGEREDPPKSRVLGCFGLSQRTSERELRQVFERYGKIDKIMLIIDRKTGISKGYGFVYFMNDHDALEAKNACTGMEIGGRVIRVDFSLTKRAHSPTPGAYLGRRNPPSDGLDNSNTNTSRTRTSHRSRSRSHGRSRSRSSRASYSRSRSHS